MLVCLLNSNRLAGEDLAQVDLAAIEADAAASGDGDSLVVERIIELGQALVEIQLLLGRKGGEGATRTQLGKMAKCSAPRVTEAVKGLSKERLIHQTVEGIYFLTGTGEADLMKWLAAHKGV